MKARFLFRSVWWLSNILLAVAFVAVVWSGVWEYFVRKYLKGFSDAVVPGAADPRQKEEAILAWMTSGPPRRAGQPSSVLSTRDPENTLNYRQLLKVCGTATNAFLNLSRSAGLRTRRLLLLTPERTVKHVVAEVYLGDRWVIVDPSYRTFLKDSEGNLLTRTDLQKPQVFHEASSAIPNYPPEYNYERFAHVRLSALPFHGGPIRRILDDMLPGWDEYLDWSLLLERRSLFFLVLSGTSFSALLFVRLLLGWLADRRLRIPRFHLRANLVRAAAALFTTPEIK